MIRILLLILLMSVWSSSSSAGTYYCTFSEILMLSDDGTLEPHPLESTLIESQLVVDDLAGRTFHPEFGNSAYPFVLLLDHGSSVSSLKVIAYSELGERPEAGVPSFRNSSYTEIKTYAEGVSKPVLTMSGSSIGIGMCK